MIEFLERGRVVPLDQLVEDADNPRVDFDHLDELAQSLATFGQLVPLIVTSIVGGDVRWLIRAGARRHRALRLAGIETAIVDVVAPDTPSDVIAAAENLDRAPLGLLEEVKLVETTLARLAPKLAPDDRRTPAMHLAIALGRSERWARQRLRLAALSPTARTWLERLTRDAAHALALLPAETQDAVLGQFARWNREGDVFSRLDVVRASESVRLALSTAPFGLTVVYEGTQAHPVVSPTCEGCSLRSDAQVDLFAGREPAGGVCLRPECWSSKTMLTYQQAVSEHIRRGGVVSDSTEPWSDNVSGRLVLVDAPARTLSQSAGIVHEGKLLTWRQVLDDEFGPSTEYDHATNPHAWTRSAVLLRDPVSGAPALAFERKVAERALGRRLAAVVRRTETRAEPIEKVEVEASVSITTPLKVVAARLEALDVFRRALVAEVRNLPAPEGLDYADACEGLVAVAALALDLGPTDDVVELQPPPDDHDPEALWRWAVRSVVDLAGPHGLLLDEAGGLADGQLRAVRTLAWLAGPEASEQLVLAAGEVLTPQQRALVQEHLSVAVVGWATPAA